MAHISSKNHRLSIRMRIPIYMLLLFSGFGLRVDAQSNAGIATQLTEINTLAEQVLAASEKAANAVSVDDVKIQADQVFSLIWGARSGRDGTQASGAVPIHGWKTRWQVDNSAFDEAFAGRYGVTPPEIADTDALGIMGRGRALRNLLQARLDNGDMSDSERMHTEAVIASLNNVIGWMKMDDGVTKGERQPRVDLTREWDSPTEFWLSTADTGWIPEVFSQAINIMKVDYEGDVEEARLHAKGMVELARKVIEGVDADGNGSVEPVKMEGGMKATIAEARAAGFVRG